MISRQNSLELHLGCYTCWLSYFTLVCLWWGQMVARSVYGHVISKFSRMGRLLHFVTHGPQLGRLARKSYAINYWMRISVIYNNYSPKWKWLVVMVIYRGREDQQTRSSHKTPHVTRTHSLIHRSCDWFNSSFLAASQDFIPWNNQWSDGSHKNRHEWAEISLVFHPAEIPLQ